MKHLLSLLIIFLSSLLLAQVENQLLERSFWKTKPGIEKVKERIELGDDPAALTSNKFDPMVWAILDDASPEVFDLLLSKKGNDVNKITHDERTYIFWAAYKSNIDLMKKLIDLGAKLDHKDEYGYSVATFAASSGQSNPEIYMLLHDQGFDLRNDRFKNGANPFLFLASSIQSEKDYNIFLRLGFDIKNVDHEGNNVFVYASSTCNGFILGKASELGLDPNANNSESAYRAVAGTRAKKNGVRELSRLKEMGVDFTKFDGDGNSCLHIASQRNSPIEVVTWLLELGCELDSKNKDGMTPYLTAVESGKVDMVQFFESKQVNTAAANEDGNTDFHLAVLNSNYEMLKFLSHNTSNINVKNSEGYTPLHLMAMKAEKLEMLKFLFDLGANKNSETDFGERAYDLAKENEKLNSNLSDLDFLK